jgi:hypothetical protein
MKSLVASVIAVGLLAPAAHAGMFVGVGVGTGAATGGVISDFGSDGQHSGRLELGERFGFVSVMGGLNYYGVTTQASWDAVSTVAAVKLDLPIIPVVNGYVRVGLEHTWIQPPPDSGTAQTLSGNGWTGGLGVEYKLDAFIANASVWLDYTRHADTFQRGNTTAEGTANMWTIGASFGL